MEKTSQKESNTGKRSNLPPTGIPYFSKNKQIPFPTIMPPKIPKTPTTSPALKKIKAI